MAYINRSAVPELLARLMRKLVSGYIPEGASGLGPPQDITIVSGGYIREITGYPNQSVGNYDALIVSHHRTMQLAKLTTHFGPVRSPHISLESVLSSPRSSTRLANQAEMENTARIFLSRDGSIGSEKRADSLPHIAYHVTTPVKSRLRCLGPSRVYRGAGLSIFTIAHCTRLT